MKVIAAVAGVVIAGMVALELAMNPSSGDRLELLSLFIAMAVFTVAAVRLVPRIGLRTRSLGHTVAAVGLVAAGLIALGVTVGAWRMFLSVHDLHLLTTVVGVAAGLSVVFAVGITRSLRDDLAALRRTTDDVARGDLSARTGIVRADELGALATALDAMIARLSEAEDQRRADDEARRTLLAAIGHDLRTPLAALQASLEALQDGLAGDPQRYLHSMSRDVDHLRAMVDDLFLIARIEAGELTLDHELVDLAELADETVEVMTPVARARGVQLRLEAAGRLPVEGGPMALGRVMRNLVDNAIRYAPAHSEVVVRVSNGDAAVVEVLDDGPGFDRATLTHAFERFTRADPSRNRDTGGAGLGLAIAKGVIDAHGGEMWAAEGPGGRVGFRLPPAPSLAGPSKALG
jgi:signal transduction histidine kinase